MDTTTTATATPHPPRPPPLPAVVSTTSAKQQKEVREKEKAAMSVIYAFYLRWTSAIKNNMANDEMFRASLTQAFHKVLNAEPPLLNFPRAIADMCHLGLSRADKSTAELDPSDANNPMCQLKAGVDIFSHLNDKDVFFEHMWMLLAQRLLDSGDSASDISTAGDAHRKLVDLLKDRCGHFFTAKLESMMRDSNQASQLQELFNEHLERQAPPAKRRLPIPEFRMVVVNSSYWPKMKFPPIPLAPIMAECVRAFEGFYNAKFAHRVLNVCATRGNARLRFWPKGRQPRERPSVAARSGGEGGVSTVTTTSSSSNTTSTTPPTTTASKPPEFTICCSTAQALLLLCFNDFPSNSSNSSNSPNSQSPSPQSLSAKQLMGMLAKAHGGQGGSSSNAASSESVSVVDASLTTTGGGRAESMDDADDADRIAYIRKLVASCSTSRYPVLNVLPHYSSNATAAAAAAAAAHHQSSPPTSNDRSPSTAGGGGGGVEEQDSASAHRGGAQTGSNAEPVSPTPTPPTLPSSPVSSTLRARAAKQLHDEDRLQINSEFQSRALLVKLPTPYMEEPSCKQKIDKDRDTVLDAAIVRIMKADHELNHEALLDRVRRLVHSFRPEAQHVKRRIESLLEREYLLRQPTKNDVTGAPESVYVYLS
eukprot:GHVU01011641.1.p1 GENE.GHVU01011641.1~~GHVU01011641.1.p1  ORF type:complete len:650 (+),score=150.27 GHVU01011641.1:51-2000(+)